LIDLFLLYKTVFLVSLDNLIFQHLSGLEMNYPGGQNQHFRHLLFFAFHRGQKAAEAAWDICNVYGEGVLGVSTAQKLFEKFKMATLTWKTRIVSDDLRNSTRTDSRHF